MSSLAYATWFLSSFLIVFGLLALAAPSAWRGAMAAFPRHTPSAVLLTAVDLIWVAWLLLDMTKGRFAHLQPIIYIAAPVSFFLLTRYMEELLAPRALGGLLLLAAGPALDAARWNDSSLRLIFTTLIYVMIIKGIVLILSPYRFRDWGPGRVRTDAAARAVGIAILLLASGLGALAAVVY